MTNIWSAAQNGKINLIEKLLADGFDINLKNNNGSTALIFASKYSNTTRTLETVKLLLESGANVDLQNNNGNTALIFASKYSNTTSTLETVKLLLESGANVDLQDNTGKTALIYAPNIETVQILLQAGANPFISTQNMGCKTEECLRVVETAAWKRLRERDLDVARRFAKDVLTKEVWQLILLNERQRKLCRNLNNPANKYLLIAFAIDVGADPEEIKNMNKAQLCGFISRQIGRSAGGGMSQILKEKRNLNDIEKKLIDLAYMYNIDTAKPVKDIFSELYERINK